MKSHGLKLVKLVLVGTFDKDAIAGRNGNYQPFLRDSNKLDTHP